MEEKMTQTKQDLSQTVREVAATRDHRLAAYLVSGEHEISPAQFYGIMKHLRGCPKKEPARLMEENVGRARIAADVQAARGVIKDIPAGFFATPSRTGNNDLDFWKVTVVQSGPYKGYRKAKRVVGGGDSLLPRLIDISKPEQAAALSAILQAGITTAQEAYADEEERCMKCGRQLTDAESRARRMGDTCAGKA